MGSHQFRILRHGPLLAVLVSLVLVPLVLVSPAFAGENGFDCSSVTAKSTSEQQNAAAELLISSWDTAKLACAAKIMISIADQNTGQFDAQLAALEANARYLYYLDRIVLYELGYLIVSYTTDVPQEKMLNQPMIDLMAAQEEQLRILNRAREAGHDAPELKYFEALGIGPTAPAMPLLKDVVAADPPSLAGAAHALLGEIYYALPDLAGGDLDLSIKMMREALKRSPGNPHYTRLLAGYLLDTGQSDESRSLLEGLLSGKTDAADLQLVADQLRIAGDVASRIPDEQLAQQLWQQRGVMLDEHPYLQNRNVVVALGHFGDKNPMKD
jgi:tetratricopeptide (TPR) repeat protein